MENNEIEQDFEDFRNSILRDSEQNLDEYSIHKEPLIDSLKKTSPYIEQKYPTIESYSFKDITKIFIKEEIIWKGIENIWEYLAEEREHMQEPDDKNMTLEQFEQKCKLPPETQKKYEQILSHIRLGKINELLKLDNPSHMFHSFAIALSFGYDTLQVTFPKTLINAMGEYLKENQPGIKLDNKKIPNIIQEKLLTSAVETILFYTHKPCNFNPLVKLIKNKKPDNLKISNEKILYFLNCSVETTRNISIFEKVFTLFKDFLSESQLKVIIKDICENGNMDFVREDALKFILNEVDIPSKILEKVLDEVGRLSNEATTLFKNKINNTSSIVVHSTEKKEKEKEIIDKNAEVKKRIKTEYPYIHTKYPMINQPNFFNIITLNAIKSQEKEIWDNLIQEKIKDNYDNDLDFFSKSGILFKTNHSRTIDQKINQHSLNLARLGKFKEIYQLNDYELIMELLKTAAAFGFEQAFNEKEYPDILIKGMAEKIKNYFELPTDLTKQQIQTKIKRSIAIGAVRKSAMCSKNEHIIHYILNNFRDKKFRINIRKMLLKRGQFWTQGFIIGIKDNSYDGLRKSELSKILNKDLAYLCDKVEIMNIILNNEYLSSLLNKNYITCSALNALAMMKNHFHYFKKLFKILNLNLNDSFRSSKGDIYYILDTACIHSNTEVVNYIILNSKPSTDILNELLEKYPDIQEIKSLLERHISQNPGVPLIKQFEEMERHKYNNSSEEIENLEDEVLNLNLEEKNHLLTTLN